MPIFETVCIILLVALVWFWLEGLMVREAAIRAARAACDADGFLLLDYTVAMSAMKPARDENGRLGLQRTYDFEYSDTGNNRLKGSVVLLGRRLVLFNVGVRESSIARMLP
jgi:hypothetical protein